MTIAVYDQILDTGLTGYSGCTAINICSAMPTNYLGATANYMLGGHTGNPFPAPSSWATGRQVVAAAIAGGSVTASGNAVAWAAIDTVNSRLLGTGSIASTAVVAGQIWNLASFTLQESHQATARTCTIPVLTLITVAAPSITLARNTGAQNTLFNVLTGGTTLSNALDVYGTSSSPSGIVSVYVDTVLNGTTTADASGNWVYTLASTLSDAAHAITATITAGGGTSAQSAAFNVTVAPGLTSLPVSIGSNMVDNQSFSWGGEGFVTNSTNQTTGHVNTACCIVADTHTLDFTLLHTDLYADFGTSNRSEIAMTGRYADGVTLNMSWQAWLDPASPVNDNHGPGEWCVFPGQLHDSGGSSPVVELNLGGDADHTGIPTGDQFCVDKYDGTTYSQAFRDAGNLPRGVIHSFDMIVKPHATAGILSVWKNGVHIVNYTGPLHETSPYYWKKGMYRGPTPGEDQDQHYKIHNFLCIRT